jgi:hypothetical protein
METFLSEKIEFGLNFKKIYCAWQIKTKNEIHSTASGMLSTATCCTSGVEYEDVQTDTYGLRKLG